jgi:hypothetical protein
MCIILVIKPSLTHWSSLQNSRFTWLERKSHSGVDRGCLLLLAPNPTSCISRGPCLPILWFVFPTGLMRSMTVRYLCHYIIYLIDKVHVLFTFHIVSAVCYQRCQHGYCSSPDYCSCYHGYTGSRCDTRKLTSVIFVRTDDTFPTFP